MANLRSFVLVVVIAALAASSVGQSSGSSKGSDKKRDGASSSRSRTDDSKSRVRNDPRSSRPPDARSTPTESPIGRVGKPTSSRPDQSRTTPGFPTKQDPLGRLDRPRTSPGSSVGKDPRSRSDRPDQARTTPGFPSRQDPVGKVDRPRTTPGVPVRQDPIGRVDRPRTTPGTPVRQEPSKGSRVDRPVQSGKTTSPPRVRETPGKLDGQSGVLGKTNYRTSNNLRGLLQPGFDRGSVVIERAPILGRGGLPELVLREEARWRDNRDGRRGGLRSGYCQYDARWRDDRFYYPHYAFDPYSRRCTISPWYYYPQLPAYILLERIIFIDSHRCDFDEGDDYRWSKYDGYGDRYGSYGELDQAIGDIVDAFERQDSRSLGQVISRSTRVGIWVDGRYSYSLNSDDFYDLMQDNIRGTDTIRYEIRSVRRTGDGASVTAQHQFNDPWGGYSVVTHRYKLRRDRSGYYITDFQSSRDW